MRNDTATTELPEGFAPLDPEKDYVDVTEFDKQLLIRMNMLEQVMQKMADAMVAMQQSLIRAHEKQCELEADLLAAGIGSAKASQSAIIMPDKVKIN